MSYLPPHSLNKSCLTKSTQKGSKCTIITPRNPLLCTQIYQKYGNVNLFKSFVSTQVRQNGGRGEIRIIRRALVRQGAQQNPIIFSMSQILRPRVQISQGVQKPYHSGAPVSTLPNRYFDQLTKHKVSEQKKNPYQINIWCDYNQPAKQHKLF